MDEAIDLAIEGRSPYPEKTAFIGLVGSNPPSARRRTPSRLRAHCLASGREPLIRWDSGRGFLALDVAHLQLDWLASWPMGAVERFP